MLVDLTRINDPLIAFAAGQALADDHYEPLTSKSIFERVGKLRVADLRDPNLSGSLKRWIAKTDQERRCYVVTQTGLSWTSGSPAKSYARSLIDTNGGNPAMALQVVQADMTSSRSAEDIAWWSLVKAELHSVIIEGRQR